MKLFGKKVSMSLILGALFLIFLIMGTSGCGCMKCGLKEGLTTLGEDLKITNLVMDNYEKIGSSHETNRKVAPSKSMTENMFFFDKNEFSKDCCKDNQSGYSNKHGCVCATSEQARFLSSRGGNSSGVNSC